MAFARDHQQTPEQDTLTPCAVNVSSETGRLRAVLLHRPGMEIERMTPSNASKALYSDILNKPIVDEEYGNFSGVLERWAKVYYVEDIIALLMNDDNLKTLLLEKNLAHYDETARNRIMDIFAKEGYNARQLTRVLIEGFEDPEWDGVSNARYLLKPLYNLFYARDASSTIYDRVLINSMSFAVRRRESHIYESIFKHFFKVDTLNAKLWDKNARTEGGDVHIAAPDLLCIGQGVRTNAKGIEYLAHTFGRDRDTFHILVQDLPYEPASFIHLDMAFTFLGKHECMIYEPMYRRKGLFSTMNTTLVTIDHGKCTYRTVDNIVDGLNMLGWDIKPIIMGGNDPWVQEREQWHSGANFFALDDCRILGYRRNTHTIDALDKAGFTVLNAEDIVSGKVDMNDYQKFIATMPGSELPRGGGGARCMTMPILRD